MSSNKAFTIFTEKVLEYTFGFLIAAYQKRCESSFMREIYFAFIIQINEITPCFNYVVSIIFQCMIHTNGM